MEQIIGLCALLVIFFSCTWMVMWCKYRDGVFGKGALILICIGAAIMIGEILMDESDYDFSQPTLLILCGAAAFFLRHLILRLSRLGKGRPARRREDRS